MTIRARLWIGIGLMMAAVVGLATLGLGALVVIDREYTFLLEVHHQQVAWALRLKTASQAEILAARSYVLTDDRSFLEALHYFSVHNISWRALPERFGKWNSVWKRFDRLSKAGVFEIFFDHLASLSASAHLVQMFDSTIVRAHISAAGAKGGRRARRSAVRAAASRPRSI